MGPVGTRVSLVPNSRVLLVAAVSIAFWVPLARMEWFWGDEKTSYILRTVEWAAELRAGSLYPRWCPDFYGGYGSPLFMFYGPVIYALAGTLTAAFVDPHVALKVVALLGCLASGLGTYALAWGETRQRDAAFLSAMAFLAAPYWSGNLYIRGDLGEFSCLALMPSVLALYRASAFEARPLRARWLAIAASVLHAVLILTHPVLGLWGTLIIGAVVAVSALGLARRRMWRRATELVVALASASLLSGLYAVPALIDKKATQTARMVVGFYNPQYHWSTFDDFFWVHPRNVQMIGPGLLFALIMVLAGIVKRPRSGVRALGWLSLCGVLVLLNVPQMSWFWAPNRLPLVEYIQFPWRLFGPAMLVAAVVAGLGMAAAFRGTAEDLRFGFAIVASTALVLGVGSRHAANVEMAIADVPRDAESVRSGMGSATDANEYLPRAVPAPPTAAQRDLVLSATGAAVSLAHSDGSRHFITLRAERSGARLVLAVHSFPGWTVDTVQGPRRAKLASDPSGLIRIDLPAAGDYRLRVRFGPSTAARAGLFVSGIGVLVLALLALWPSRTSWFRRRAKEAAASG